METLAPPSQETVNCHAVVPKKPIGRFIVGHATLSSDWHALLPLMAKLVVIRAESLYHMAGIEYLALCDDFEMIDQGAGVPFYDVVYRQGELGEDLFFFTKRNE